MPLIEQEPMCLLCGGNTVLLETDFPGYKEPDTFNIYNCRICNSSFALPQGNNQPEIYDLIYKNLNKIPNYYRYWHYAENITNQKDPFDYLADQEEAYWSIKQALVSRLDTISNSRILEIGCGLGYLTYSLNKAGFNSAGIDISSEAIKYANSKYGPFYTCADIKEYALINPGSYDIIIMTEVLEHVQDVKNFLIVTKKLLKNNGKIILTTPDKTLFSEYSSWFTELPPIHSWWFSETSLRKCGELLNMKVEFIDFKDFYRNPIRDCLINFKNISEEKPTFDKCGNIIKHNGSGESLKPRKRRIMILLKKLLGLKNYNNLKILYYSSKSNFKVLGSKGYSLCAILYS